LFFRLALPFSDNYFSKFGRANHFSRLTCLHKIFYSLQKFKKTKPSKKMTKSEASDLLNFIEKSRTEGIPLSKEGNIWFANALTAYRLQCWENLYKEIIKNLDADPEGNIGKKLAAKWRGVISQHVVGSKDFYLDSKLLMESAQTKVGLQDSATITPEQRQKMMQDSLKMLLDPMVISWIEIALRSH